MKFSGFPLGSRVVLALNDDVVSIDTYGIVLPDGLAAPTAGQILLADDQAVTGDVATLSFGGVPTEPGYVVNHFEYTLDGGVTIHEVPMGPWADYTRRIRVAASAQSSIQVRVQWRPEANEEHDETGVTPGIWSPAVNVTTTVGTPRMTITASRTTVTAPAGIKFRAEASGYGGLTSYKDVLYTWDFGEAGATYSRLASDFPWGNDANSAQGPAAAHVFDEPGIYTVTCTGRVRGVPVFQDTTTVTVADPNTVYIADNTVCFSNDPSETDFPAELPAGFRQELSDDPVNQAERLDLWVRARANESVRILLRRGQTFDASVLLTPRYHVNFLFEAYGPETDPDPIVNGAFWVRDATGDIAFRNVDIRGPYDPANPYTTAYPEEDGIRVHGDNNPSVTIHNCRLAGHNRGVSPEAGIDFLCISNSEITDWFDYGVQGYQDGLHGQALLGSSIRQNPLTERSLGKEDTGAATGPYHANHGPYRLSAPIGDFIVSKVDTASANDWSGAETSVQPNFRRDFWGDGRNPALREVFDRVRSEGSGLFFGLGGQADQRYIDDVLTDVIRVAAPSEYVVDKWHHVAGPPSSSALVVSKGGAVVRNVAIVVPDVPVEDTAGLTASGLTLGIVASMNYNLSRAQYQPVDIYNVTFLDLRSNVNVKNSLEFLAIDRGDTPFETVNACNILHLAPNASPAINAGAADLTQAWVPQYPGRIFDGGSAGAAVLDALFSADGAGILPYPLAPLPVGDPPGLLPVDDLLGKLRPETPNLVSQGALEPSS